MKFRAILLGAAMAVTSVAAASAGTYQGWYVSLEGGANWIQDWDVIVPGPTSGSVSFDTGWAVMASVGHAFASNWRAELEVGYRDNDIDAIITGGVPGTTTGNLTEASVMGNIVYDINLGNKVGLSLGVGAGADWAEMTTVPGGESDEWNLAYQGIAGLNYAVGRQTSAFINYRYFRVHEPELATFISTDDIQKHTVTLGIRYALQSSQQAVTDTQPPITQPPLSEPAGPSRQFIVFFGFNKYNLTSAALRVISEAVTAAKETGSATLVITGHTDTVGSGDYNQRLSVRRSNAVKAEMVRQGVAPGAISTTGRGETELLVQTNDNVKEPQNRRATIDVN